MGLMSPHSPAVKSELRGSLARDIIETSILRSAITLAKLGWDRISELCGLTQKGLSQMTIEGRLGS
eukprot:1990018-Pyramimonas_sp.AAC.1